MKFDSASFDRRCAGPADRRANCLCAVRRPVGQARGAGELCRNRRHRGALGGIVYRARQSVDPSALRELPSRRGPSASGRTGPAASAAGRARRRRPWPSRHALFDLPRRGQLRSGPRAGTSGVASGAARYGLGRQDARGDLRADQGPRAQWRPLIGRARASHRRRFAGRLGLGAGIRAAPCARHAETSESAHRSLGENRRSLSEVANGPFVSFSQASSPRKRGPSNHCTLGDYWVPGLALRARPGRQKCYGKSARLFGPGPGVIRVGHWCEPNGTCGGRFTGILRLASSSMIACRASPPISS